MKTGKYVTRLNSSQQEAVDLTTGPALVVAGAGTGKTRVIVERILKLIENGTKPENILALTFTEKAAQEMLDRVSDVSLSAGIAAKIATFNGFGQELLDTYGSEWGMSNLRLLGDIGELVFVRDHFDEFDLDYFAPLSNPLGQLKTLCEYVSKCKQELVSPDAYLNYAESLPTADDAERIERQKQREIASFYKKYLELARQKQVITYDDQIFMAIELLKARPNILRDIQERYHYVLVDEFQDTNTMQSALIDLLAEKQKNLMVVGDDDQAIYGWRGATLANILNFKQRYPAAKDITLIENYRNTQPILDAAYRLIQHNNPDRLEHVERLDKRLRAQTSTESHPTVKRFYTHSSELTWVAEDIAHRLADGADAGQIAVLARGNSTVNKVHEALEMHGVEHVVVGVQTDLYSQPVVRSVVEVLKAINDPLDSTALFHCLTGPAFDLPQSRLSELASTARLEQRSLIQTIADAEDHNFKEALDLLSRWRETSATISVRRLVYDVITDSGWKDRLFKQATQNDELVLQTQALNEYFNTLKEFERIANLPSVQSYILNYETLRSGGDSFDGSEVLSPTAVNVMTVHKSKGLEWKSVYIVNCVQGSFPSTAGSRGIELPAELLQHASRADERLSEERRAMYVAITRAREELTLTYSDKIREGGSRRKPSLFLHEMFGADGEPETAFSSRADIDLFASEGSVPTTIIPSKILKNGVYTLSASQIACYLNCPYDFYYKHVLSIPQAEGASASYGTAIHAGIQYIGEQRLQGRTPGYEEVLSVVEAKMPSRGFASEAVKQKNLGAYLESTKRMYGRFISDPLPLHIEKPFNVAVPDTPVRIKGRIDAVYDTPRGIEIRDYKTSRSVRTADVAKRKASENKQLTVYALAWLLEHGELPALEVLDFVETGQRGEVRRTNRAIATLTDNLSKIVTSMQDNVYPLGHNHDFCAHP
jgi:DNA helicase-2/ATP-dependent DNA helicase PcrA